MANFNHGSFFVKLIGDVHGKFRQYRRIIEEHPDTIQVGDMGVGFRRWPHGEWCENPPYDRMVATNARFIRGNHDNPFICAQHPRGIADGHVEITEKGNKVMFIGGGLSIDKEFRIEDYSWWPEEELSQKQMWDIAQKYLEEKPDVMITHVCPSVHVDYIHASHHRLDNSRTTQFLQNLWAQHQPKLWVHGHHHVSTESDINGTKFVCLAELEMREFDI